MNMKKITLSFSTILLIGALSNGLIVNADDDDDDHKYYEKYKKYRDDDWDEHDDDDDKYEYEEDEEYKYENNTYSTVSKHQTWNIWTRTITVQKGELPFNDPKNVTLKLENETNELSIYVIPRDGELLVPGKSIAEFLGAETSFYKTSQILEVSDTNTNLILRANTNVAYDDDVKTPIPSIAFYLNNDIYIPISVIVNGLGYLVEWQEENNTFICQLFATN